MAVASLGEASQHWQWFVLTVAVALLSYRRRRKNSIGIALAAVAVEASIEYISFKSIDLSNKYPIDRSLF